MAKYIKTQIEPKETVIQWEQLLKAKRSFDLENRKIIIFAFGIELPITKYLINYWEKRDRFPQFIEYLDKHNELANYMYNLANTKNLCV
jgi:uncharacterized protein YpmS